MSYDVVDHRFRPQNSRVSELPVHTPAKDGTLPNQTLDRGQTARFGAGLVDELTLNGVGADYTVTINNGAPQVGVAAPGRPVRFNVNGSPVAVENSTPGPGPVNLTISW
jgi:hypothetical protein